MPFELRPFAPETVTEASQIVLVAYKESPFRRVLKPHGATSESLDKIRDQYRKLLDDRDNAHLVQLYDTDLGRTAAYAVWVHTEEMNDEKWDRHLQKRIDTFPDARQDLVVPFLRKENIAKRKVMGYGRWWELDTLNVHPEYQRKGLGARLLQEGMTMLAQKKLPGVLVASQAGYGLYSKYGWETREKYFINLDDIGGYGMYFNAVMTWHPELTKTEATDGAAVNVEKASEEP